MSNLDVVNRSVFSNSELTVIIKTNDPVQKELFSVKWLSMPLSEAKATYNWHKLYAPQMDQTRPILKFLPKDLVPMQLLFSAGNPLTHEHRYVFGTNYTNLYFVVKYIPRKPLTYKVFAGSLQAVKNDWNTRDGFQKPPLDFSSVKADLLSSYKHLLKTLQNQI